MELRLDCHGITVCISTNERVYFEVLENLKEDFSHFYSQNSSESASIQIDLKAFTPVPIEQRGWFFFKNKAASVYGWGNDRIVDYGREAWIQCSQESRRHPREFQIYCAQVRDAWELAYLTLLSSIGEALDKRGWHRAHALGIGVAGISGIVCLPSGSGKSSMAALLSNDKRFKIFSDETPLISNAEMRAFPVRIALHPEVAQALNMSEDGRPFKRRLYPEKILYPIPSVSIAEKSRLSFIVISGSFKNEVPTIRPCSKLTVFFVLLDTMVIGRGIAQIGELMIRPDSFFSLIRIAISRLREALRIVLRSGNYVFELSTDARKNAEVLEDFLLRQAGLTAS